MIPPDIIPEKFQIKKEFKTIGDCIEYILPLVEYYRRFTDEKSDVARELRVIFGTRSGYLSRVVRDGKFSDSFRRKMGAGRMRALKKILLEVDSEYYSRIDFGI